MVIVSPAQFNDLLLGTLVKKLANRITKYGARYNYELTKTPKPEYAAWLKEVGLDKEIVVVSAEDSKEESK